MKAGQHVSSRAPLALTFRECKHSVFVKFESVEVLLAPVSMQTGMVIASVVSDYDHPKVAHAAARRMMVRDGIPCLWRNPRLAA
jgi:hypothetical protein